MWCITYFTCDIPTIYNWTDNHFDVSFATICCDQKFLKTYIRLFVMKIPKEFKKKMFQSYQRVVCDVFKMRFVFKRYIKLWFEQTFFFFNMKKWKFMKIDALVTYSIYYSRTKKFQRLKFARRIRISRTNGLGTRHIS